MNAGKGRFSITRAQAHFIVISVVAVLVNTALQVILPVLAPLPAVWESLLVTGTVAICIIPLGVAFCLRPLSAALTGERRAQETIRNDEMHYRIVSELTTTFIFKLSVSAAGEITLDFLSESFYTFAGRRDEARTFSSLMDHIHPGDRAAVTGSLGTLVADARSVEMDCRAFLGEPHQTRWVRLSARSERDPVSGRVTSIAGAVTDITQQKSAEEALRASEEHFRRMFDSSALGMVLVSLDLRFMQVNQGFCAMLGYVDTELLGRTFQDVTFEEDRSKGSELVARLLSGTVDVFHLEKRFVRKDGRLRWGLVSVTAFRDSGDAPRYLVAQVQDITDRKAADQALVRSEQGLKKAQRYAHVGSWTWDIRENRVEWSDEMFNIFGIGRDSFSGSLPDVIARSIHPDDRARVDESNLSVVQQGKPVPLEYRIVRPDRSVRTVWAEAGELVYDAAGSPTFLSGYVQDITDQRKADEQRAAVEQSLQKMQKLESLGVLAGGIAHDFNNMLAGVFGYMDLARILVTDQTAAGYLALAGQNIERAKGLTQQLLTFAKGGEPVKKSISLAALIRDTTSFALSGSNARCELRLADGLWSCEADGNQIGQVIQNLVLNASQAMPMGGTIHVGAANVTLGKQEHPLLPEGEYVAVTVADTGIGIPREMLPRIFDPFFTTKTRGHGLGLSTAYSVVRKHNGAIDVESELGKGSAFRVLLPAGGAAEEGGRSQGSVTHQGTGTILVMDDEPSVRGLLARMLSSLGYTVVATENGEQALEYFRQGGDNGKALSAVILDLTIPAGLGGKVVSEEIRKTNRDIPIFVTSGYAEDPVVAHPEEYGITGGLGKPFSMRDLMELLERALPRVAARAPL